MRPPLREERARFYAPASFLRDAGADAAAHFLQDLDQAAQAGTVVFHGSAARVAVRFLEWDTRHFDCPTYRIDFTDWDEGETRPADALARTVGELRHALAARHPRYSLFAEVPSEDTVALQGLGGAGLALIETRLTYFHPEASRFSPPERHPVREATADDIPHLRRVAAEARNAHDRFHADPFYSEATADAYLATFAENSVRGFADAVLVPAGDEAPPGAFFTLNLPASSGLPAEAAAGRIVLVAVGPERRGWHARLLAEATRWLGERGARVVCMTTQSTNRAVIRNCEKLGYRYGRSTHILTAHE